LNHQNGLYNKDGPLEAITMRENGPGEAEVHKKTQKVDEK
jgi:hypothetical protein